MNMRDIHRYSDITTISSEVLCLFSLFDGTQFVDELQSCCMLDFQSFILLVHKILRKIFQHVVSLPGTWGLHLPQDEGEDAITLQRDSSIMEAGP